MEAVLAESKGYEHDETKRLLEELRELFQSRLRVVVSEHSSMRAKEAEQEARDPVETFQIERSGEPIYALCGSVDDLEKILDAFNEKLNELYDHFEELLDKNSGLDDESRESLECYASAVDKCANVYGTQRRKRLTRFKELPTVAEIRDELQLLFSEIISNYIVVVLCDPLYERVKNGSGPVYEMAVREINGFLAEVGVYTKAVAPGEMIDPEFMEPTPDSAENYTDDFRRFDVVERIYRYPYLFSDGAKVIDGRVRIWRRRD